MLAAICSLLVSACPQHDPLDAFRGNLQATECALDFTYVAGIGIASEICAGQAWKKPPITTVREKRERCVLGRWETDGLVQRSVMRLPDDVLRQRAAEFEAGLRETTIADPAEFLNDGDLVAFHGLGSRQVSVHPALSNRFYLIAYKGPYSWWSQKFPDAIDDKWHSAQRQDADGKHGGYATRDVILNMDIPGESNSLVIAFDGSIGFLPRYGRMLTRYEQDDSAVIREFWMMQTTRCSSGGFVPIDWIESGFWIQNFRQEYRTIDHETVFKCPSKEVEFVRFTVTSFEDRRPELALACAEGFNYVHTPSSGVTLSSNPTSLTLRELRNVLGAKPYEPGPTAPRIAMQEVREFDQSGGRLWKRVLCAALVVLGTVLLFVAYRRWRVASLLILVTAVFASGCKPAPNLQARFKDDIVLFDTRDTDPTLVLAIQNTGNCNLLIRNLAGDCVCSIVGDTQLPQELKPRATMQANVRIQKRFDLQPRHLTWNIKTDRGDIRCKTSVLLLPTATLSPFSRNFQGLEVDQTISFEIASKRIWNQDDPAPSVSLHVPEKLRAKEKARRSGPGPVTGFRFEETTYAISIEDTTTLGQHKEEVEVRTAEGETLATAMVLWQRVRHVTVVPASVVLSDNKVRLFLRCRDDNVEFVRVVEVPEGINAVVSSPRELSVWPKVDAPDQVTGEVVLETSAATEPVIRIPLQRTAASHSTPSSDALRFEWQ